MKSETKLEKIKNAFFQSILNCQDAMIAGKLSMSKESFHDFCEKGIDATYLKHLITYARKLGITVPCPNCGNNLLTPTEAEKNLINDLKKIEQLPFWIFNAYQELERVGDDF